MTAPINSRVSNIPVGPDVEPDSPAPATPAVARPQGDRVQAWSDEPGYAPAASSSPGMNSAFATGSRSAEDVTAELDTLMHRGSCGVVRDLLVTKGDAREAVAALETLSPKEYQRALKTVDGETLKQLFAEMDAPTRSAFFEQARQKGALTEEPGVRMPPREGSPPDKPALVRNDARLRPELRAAIHTENTARAAEYMRQFDGYVGRYRDAALAATSPMALRLMGPPLTEFALYEPGVVGKDYEKFGTLRQGTSDRAPAARAVSDRIADFTGRARAGSFTFTGEAKFTAELHGNGVELRERARVTDYGKFNGEARSEAEVNPLRGISFGVDDEGKTFQELSVVGVKVKHEKTGVHELEAEHHGTGIEVEDGRTTLMATVPGVGVGGFATVDAERGSYGGGLMVGQKAHFFGLGEAELRLRAGVEVQGVSPERLPDIASMKDDGIWGPKPELDEGTKWSGIPAERRERLARDGWSQSNWPHR